MLKIDLFGVFQALRDGEPLPDLKLHSAYQLLALLILHPNHAVRNDWIAEQLWPSTGSMESLRKSIQQLRESLGPEERHRVKAEKNFVSIDLAGAEVDVIEFDAAIQREDYHSLTRALALYKGLLLKDWYESWVVPEREERKAKYLSALTNLADAALKAERYSQAARYLGQLVTARPSMDAGWERLIEALIKAGARVEALDIYQKYIAYLKRAGQARNVQLEPTPLIKEMVRQLEDPPSLIPPELMPDFAGYEPVGGAVPLNSPYYVERSGDAEAHTAIKQQESIVLIKGPRQVGKTSLLARALNQARRNGAKVILTDWQKLAPEEMESGEAFFVAQAQAISDQLHLNVVVEECFQSKRPPSTNFERFLRDKVFPAIEAPIVWGIDELDRLFQCPFRDLVFGLFRSWHNERAYDPSGPWQRFTLAMAYATEAYLFIQNLNQSPFNVGCRVALHDFTPEQVSYLNTRYGSPLRDASEIERLYELVGGHPYLVRRSLHEMKKRHLNLNDIYSEAEREDGIFADHLNRMLMVLLMDDDIAGDTRKILSGEPCPRESTVRLCSAGVMAGNPPLDLRPRCKLYDRFLRRHLS